MTTKPSLTTKFAAFLIRREVVFVAQDAHTSTCVTSARGATQSGLAPTALSPTPINQHKICTPLRPQTFARLLNNHPDQAFVSKLIKSLQTGFDIGYSGPHSPLIAPNLHSASIYPHIVDEALEKSYRQTELQVPTLPPLSLILGAQVSESYSKKTADGASYIIYLHPLTKVLMITLTLQRIPYSTVRSMTQLRYVTRLEKGHYLLRWTLRMRSGCAL